MRFVETLTFKLNLQRTSMMIWNSMSDFLFVAKWNTRNNSSVFKPSGLILNRYTLMVDRKIRNLIHYNRVVFGLNNLRNQRSCYVVAYDL